MSTSINKAILLPSCYTCQHLICSEEVLRWLLNPGYKNYLALLTSLMLHPCFSTVCRDLTFASRWEHQKTFSSGWRKPFFMEERPRLYAALFLKITSIKGWVMLQKSKIKVAAPGHAGNHGVYSCSKRLSSGGRSDSLRVCHHGEMGNVISFKCGD